MFVHGSYAHLLTNVRGLMSLGCPIHQEWGAAGLYTLFIGGGVFAAVPTPLFDRQTLLHAEQVSARYAVLPSLLL